MIKIGVTSDLHGNLPKIEPCDVFFICGDIVDLYCQRSFYKSEEWFRTKFYDWCKEAPVDRIVIIGGNHDFLLYRDYRKPKLYLDNEKVKILEDKFLIMQLDNGDMLEVYGTPQCKIFGNWAFMKSPELLKNCYDEIPNNVDILITHDAPKIANLGMIQEGYYFGENAGNPWLADAILDKNPGYAFCGHIHSGNHELTKLSNGTMAANVSLVDEKYNAVYSPMYLNIESNYGKRTNNL